MGLPTPLPATRPFSVDDGLALRLAANNLSTTSLAATPIPAHRATSREELESVHQTLYDADGIIVRFRRVNGIDCDANTAIGCCAIVHAHCPHIEASCTPSLLFEEPFEEPLLLLPAEPSISPSTDLALRLANNAILTPAASASSFI